MTQDTAMIYIRTQCLAWQLPMLLLLLAALTPELPWLSASIGFWPLWLAAMPASAGLLRRFRMPLQAHVTASGQSAQVLVFPDSASAKPAWRRVSRQAA